MNRFALCCELAGDRRSGERGTRAHQARHQAADASGRERQHIEGARRQDYRQRVERDGRAWIRIPLADANRDPHILVSIC